MGHLEVGQAAIRVDLVAAHQRDLEARLAFQEQVRVVPASVVADAPFEAQAQVLVPALDRVLYAAEVSIHKENDPCSVRDEAVQMARSYAYSLGWVAFDRSEPLRETYSDSEGKEVDSDSVRKQVRGCVRDVAEAP